MKVEKLLPVTKVLAALGRPVFYYPVIGRALGCNDAAVFLGNFMYWEGKQADKSTGFIFKNANDILHETGLKRARQEKARIILCEYGILEEKKEGYPPKIYYRFNWEKLDQVLTTYINSEDKTVEMDEGIGDSSQANSETKKTNKDRQKEDETPSILYQMKEIFDEVYEKVPGFTMGYQWSKDKKGGKDWGSLKRLKEAFIERSINRKKKELPNLNEVIIPDEEILISWKMFLESLPIYHIERNFTPTLLYSNFNPIIQDIVNANKSKHQADNAGSKSTARSNASDYA